jgi:hypothetical protein
MTELKSRSGQNFAAPYEKVPHFASACAGLPEDSKDGLDISEDEDEDSENGR